MHPFMTRILFALLALAWAQAASSATLNTDNKSDLTQQGQLIANAFNQHDVAALTEMIDIESLGSSAIEGLTLSDAQRSGFLSGFVESGSQISKNVLVRFTGKSTAQLLRSKKVGNGSEHLLRLDFADERGASQGFGYVRFELNETGHIADWFDYSLGVKSSASVRNLAASLFSSPSLARTWLGVAKIDQKALDAFARFTGAMVQKQPKLAYEAMQNLPVAFKKTQEYATYRVVLGQQIDEASYRAGLEQLADYFSGKPNPPFMLIDHFFYTKQYDRAVQTIDDFEASVIKDGATSVLKCSANLVAEKSTEALAACETAVRIEPKLTLAWMTLLRVSAMTRDSAVFINAFERYEKALGDTMNAGVFANLSEYAWLQTDRRFVKWRAEREKRLHTGK
jgi:hypothetical protein